MVLGVLALLVVGPKDLPRLMRGVGQALSKVRRLADEFRASFDAMAREAELEEMRKEIEQLKATNPMGEVKTAVDDMKTQVMTGAGDGRGATPEKSVD